MSNYRRGESAQAMRASLRQIRKQFEHYEMAGCDMNWRNAYAIIDIAIRQCDDDLAAQGRAGQR